MSASEIKSEFNRLPLQARLELLFELWDELAQEPGALALSDEQKQELDRRYQRHLADPDGARSWEDVKADIRRRRDRS